MRYWPFMLLAAIAGPTQAQQWEHAEQRTEEIYFDQALPIGGNQWGVIGRAALAGSYLIKVYHADGTLAWEDNTPFFTGVAFGQEFMGEVVLTPDSGLFHVGTSDGCDYFGWQHHLQRYDRDGNVLWTRTLDSDQSMPIRAAAGPDGSMAYAAEGHIFVTDANGNPLDGFDVPTNNLKAIAWVGDSMLCSVQGTTIVTTLLDGSEPTSAVIGSSLVDMLVHNGQILVLTDDAVRTYDMALELQATTTLDVLDERSSFVTSGNDVYVQATNGLYQLEADHSIELLFPWPSIPGLTVTGCAVRDGSVFVVGNTNISGRTTGVVRLLNMAGEPIPHSEDVEVLLDVDNPRAEFSGGHYWERKADVTAHVVNHGTSDLHSVVVSMWVETPELMCTQQANRIDTSGFALAPGDTLVLPFGTVNTAVGQYASMVSGPKEVCVVALAPNLLADRFPSDNTACTTADFVMGLETPNGMPALSLFPNPGFHLVTIGGLARLGGSVQVQVMDLTGRIVLHKTVPSGAESQVLDVRALQPATYLVSAQGNRSTALAKLLVVHD